MSTKVCFYPLDKVKSSCSPIGLTYGQGCTEMLSWGNQESSPLHHPAAKSEILRTRSSPTILIKEPRLFVSPGHCRRMGLEGILLTRATVLGDCIDHRLQLIACQCCILDRCLLPWLPSIVTYDSQGCPASHQPQTSDWCPSTSRLLSNDVGRPIYTHRHRQRVSADLDQVDLSS
jgi:hypothetical protein